MTRAILVWVAMGLTLRATGAEWPPLWSWGFVMMVLAVLCLLFAFDGLGRPKEGG